MAEHRRNQKQNEVPQVCMRCTGRGDAHLLTCATLRLAVPLGLALAVRP